jgi:hypothetical protein
LSIRGAFSKDGHHACAHIEHRYGQSSVIAMKAQLLTKTLRRLAIDLQTGLHPRFPALSHTGAPRIG